MLFPYFFDLPFPATLKLKKTVRIVHGKVMDIIEYKRKQIEKGQGIEISIHVKTLSMFGLLSHDVYHFHVVIVYYCYDMVYILILKACIDQFIASVSELC